MMTKRISLLALFCVLSSAASAGAATIVIDYGTLPVLAGGQITGPSFPTTPIGANPGIVSYPGVTGVGTYSLDFFQYGGPDSNDFSFSFDGTGITSVTTNSHGSGPYPMVVGFVSGTTTLTLNTQTVVYNANSGQTGVYYANGSIPILQGPNGGPYSYTAIPGLQPVDNLYNTGGGNEDYSYIVDGSGNTLAAPGNGGGATGIPNSEYATFSGNQVNVRSETVHYVIDSSAAMGAIAPTQAMTNFVSSNAGKHIEFDVLAPIGAAGVRFNDYGIFTVTSSDVLLPDGVTPLAPSAGINDFQFLPTLRYDGLSNANGFYWLGNPGNFNTVTASVTGFFDGGAPLDMTVTAFLPEFVPPVPEPSTLALLGFGAVGLVIRTRRRRAAA